MASGDIIEVACVVNVDGEETATVMHCQQTTGAALSSTLASDVSNAMFGAGIFTAWSNRSSNEATMHCVKAQVISPDRSGASYEPVSFTGQVASDALPAPCSSLHHWQAPPYVETSKGHHFWSGVPKSLQHRNRLTEGGLLLEGTFGELFQDPVSNENTYEFGVWSRKLETFQALGVVSPRIVLRVLRSRRGRPCI